MFKRMRASAINERARKAQTGGKLEAAITLFEKAAALDPTWSAPLYNLGLLFKNECRWEESLKYNQRATEVDPKSEAAWWNLGIAATALGRWRMARHAWRSYGIEIAEGDEPVNLPCGFCPIRLNARGDAEVVWAQRIDPARAVLASIPFPESNHRWNDIVLNDGAPNGYRRVRDEDVPVFDELELLQASAFGTYVARVAMPKAEEPLAQKLAHIAAEQGGCAEDWSTSVRILCKACSEGRPHQAHDTEAAPPAGVHGVGIAARSQQHANNILAACESQLKSIEVQSLELALEPG